MADQPPLPPPPVYAPPVAGRADGMAIASLILGIISVPAAFFYGVGGIILGALALILGLVARGRIKQSGGTVGGGGLATAGWILGICGVVIGAAVIVIIVLLVISFTQASQH